jgi:Glyoxalase-like domain
MGRLLLACALALVSLAAAAQPLVQGLDHIPVAVRDLERAEADFAALGFVLKPGRPHANGLRNAHAKFPDGTEIELITATVAVDPLSSAYLEALERGDGPISVALYAPRAQPAPLEGIFFDKRQHASTDRPEHFAHPNTGFSLQRLWLAGPPAERELGALLGGVPEASSACAPFGASSARLRLPEGEILFLPASARLLPGRPIVAATVAVRSLDAVRRLVRQPIDGCTPDSLWVQTHGLWLEFRQVSSPARDRPSRRRGSSARWRSCAGWGWRASPNRARPAAGARPRVS